MATDKKKAIPLRIDPQLYDELNRWAEDELRSVNGQIEYILREAVRKRKSGSSPPQGDAEKTTD